MRALSGRAWCCVVVLWCCGAVWGRFRAGRSWSKINRVDFRKLRGDVVVLWALDAQDLRSQ